LIFEKGTKSKLHLHDSDQIIVVIKGKGHLVTYSEIEPINDNTRANLRIEKSIELKENDAVLIPSGTLHWHGASEDQNSSQLSVMKNGNTFWF
jgi:quercetin dioxygenase-like cupin family protein